MRVLVGLLLVIATAVVLVATGNPGAAAAVGNLGTAVVLLGVLAWVVVWDSRNKRWPETTCGQRLAKILSFER